MKALLQDVGVSVPRTHNLTELLDLLLPYDKTLASLRRLLKSLKRYAVEFRYSGFEATTRQMHSALRNVERVRSDCELGLD